MKKLMTFIITLVFCSGFLCGCASDNSSNRLNSTSNTNSTDSTNSNPSRSEDNKKSNSGSFQNDIYVDSSSITPGKSDSDEGYTIDPKSYPKPCTSCHGTGTCDMCNGAGYYRNPYDMRLTLECASCGGDGKCKYCNGNGSI